MQFTPVLWVKLVGWDGVEGRKEVQEGGATCILMANSRRCMTETNTTLKKNSSPNLKKQNL